MKSLHRRIRASAGTGKTFRLTDRILELLLLGAPPDRIIALTFTRKAAAEFLVKTLAKLAECASDPAKAAAFCNRRNVGPFSTEDFRRVLRCVVASLDRIEFGTLDSFFFRVVSAFAPELGLGTSLRLLPETGDSEDVRLRRELARELDADTLIDELLRLPGKAKLDPLGTEFDLLQTIEALYALYPDRPAWGDPDQIWPGGCSWTAFEKRPPDPGDDVRPTIRDSIEEFCDYATAGKLNTFAKRLLEQSAALLADDEVTILFNRKEWTLSPAERAAVRAALGHCVWGALRLRLAQARRWHGIGECLRRVRDRRLRNGLRFADLPILVQRLSTNSDLQYRLDGWFDHWLLDEFQDTSRVQWRALQPLVDEILQDASGSRSFFYVGDVKQSIYRFRDGDPTLFDEIFEHYSQHDPDRIIDEELRESRRSAPQILDTVNQTFSPDRLASLLPAEVVRRWSSAWTAHEAHATNPDGRTLRVSTPPDEYWDRIAEIVCDSGILDRPPLTCAVLVRKNDEARTALRELGQRGIPATTESNPVVARLDPFAVAISMAAAWMADPADDLARRTVEAGPLGPPAPGFLHEALEQFHLRGATGLVGRWLSMMTAVPASTAAAIRRAAREFDRNGPGSPREFSDFFETFASPEAARPGTVQIMTVHKSKGLEFDLVFVPIFSDVRIDKLDNGTAFCGDSRNLGLGTDPWILPLPSESLAQADPVLRRATAAVRERTAFDQLCTFYVAETRARRALVVLFPEKK